MTAALTIAREALARAEADLARCVERKSPDWYTEMFRVEVECCRKELETCRVLESA